MGWKDRLTKIHDTFLRTCFVAIWLIALFFTGLFAIGHFGIDEQPLSTDLGKYAIVSLIVFVVAICAHGYLMDIHLEKSE